MSASKDAKKKNSSNVLLGITGAVTFMYGLWSYLDSKFNGGTNEELEKVYQGVGGFDMVLGVTEIAIAAIRESKERKEAEATRKALEEANKVDNIADDYKIK